MKLQERLYCNGDADCLGTEYCDQQLGKCMSRQVINDPIKPGNTTRQPSPNPKPSSEEKED